MSYKPKNVNSIVCRFINFDFQHLSKGYFLYIDPLLLLLSYKLVTKLFSFLDRVEVVNYYSDEQVDDELASYNHEGHKVYHDPLAVVWVWLQIDASAIDSAQHYLFPAFSSRYLKQGVHSIYNVVKV